MTLDAHRLQRHLRSSMREQAPAARAARFTCFVHPTSDHASLNVAMPDDPVEGRRVPVQDAEAATLGAVPEDDLSYALVLVKAHYAARRRTPRIEFVVDAHPDLPDALVARGFVEETRVPLLACTSATWREIPVPSGLRVEPLLPNAPWPTVRAYLEVQRDAFGMTSAIPERPPPGHWEALQIGAGLLARVEGAPAGAGGFTPVKEGLCDARGLAVSPAHERRGLGSFLLSALARVALDAGADAMLAVPESPASLRLARRCGFEPAATLVSFRAEAAVAP